MNASIWVVVAFLLGAAVGAFLVALSRWSNTARIRDEFQAELEARIEAEMSRSEGEGRGQAASLGKSPNRAA